MWSKQSPSELVIAKMYYDANDNDYHNWSHILDCYDFLEKNHIPYNEDLDIAVLFHDAVYDNLAEKELRSANLMMSLYPERSQFVSSIIIATQQHSIRNCDWKTIAMIKADLHAFLSPMKVVENYGKIMKESMKLYNVDTPTFVTKNREFMLALMNTIDSNYKINLDEFWLKVNDGIKLSISIGGTYYNDGTIT
tara:strand:- start:39 stop:620 length:582 start_codon:yes stop_codon:yes gene_type:complete